VLIFGWDEGNSAVLREMCQEIELRHDLGTGFFDTLMSMSDWALVIQGHALIEAAVGDALTVAARNSKLRSIYDRLPLSDPRAGKVAFARAHDLLGDEEFAFLQTFSELRNQLVHKIGNIKFSLSDHVATMDGSQLKTWRSRFRGIGLTDSMADWLHDAARNKPRGAVWMAVVLIVYRLLPHTEDEE
jgi:hypothetical protein